MRIAIAVLLAAAGCGDFSATCEARVWEVGEIGEQSRCNNARAETREIGGKVYGVCTCDAAPDAGQVERQ